MIFTTLTETLQDIVNKPIISSPPALAFFFLIAALFVCGLLGNLLTIASVLFIKPLRKSCNVFIVSLALVDSLILIFYSIIEINSVIKFIQNYAAKVFLDFALVYFGIFSVLHLAAISIGT